MQRVRLEHDYPVSPDRLWQLATDLDALAEVSGGMVQFRGMPSGRVREGQVIDVEVSLLGLFPWRPYRMRVISCDDAARRLVSEEEGMGVELWRHSLSVTGEEGAARLIDEIEIEAGWKTPIVARWARFLYARRDAPRRRLLGLE
ncbi:hypothetical protein E0K89_015290 [Aquicoccus sp. SCR17]|nr:hypothetical protein [Carideicomes alvinocaridis]